ncbi:MAG: HigA family addiction module antitoxin [Treponema sp.]|nr:HigA family addiction module antitoxin [Treponema sp.]
MDKQFIKLDHIGKILFDDFLEPNQLSQNALAKAIGVAPSRIADIINGRRSITTDTDLRLTRFFNLSDGYFLRLQDHIETTILKQKISAELNKIIPLKKIA